MTSHRARRLTTAWVTLRHPLDEAHPETAWLTSQRTLCPAWWRRDEGEYSRFGRLPPHAGRAALSCAAKLAAQPSRLRVSTHPGCDRCRGSAWLGHRSSCDVAVGAGALRWLSVCTVPLTRSPAIKERSPALGRSMHASVAQCRSQRSRFGFVARSGPTSCCCQSWCGIPTAWGRGCHIWVYPNRTKSAPAKSALHEARDTFCYTIGRSGPKSYRRDRLVPVSCGVKKVSTEVRNKLGGAWQLARQRRSP
jgi:hypothetical protein